MAEVFISYKSEEYEDALWVKRMLETNGISCWMAPTCIPGGSSYAMEIPKAIRECKILVLVLSEQAQLSRWIPRELDQAINDNKIIMPFMLENCTLKDDFNFYLSNVQRYSAYENKSRAAQKMVNEIKALLDAHKGENETEDKSQNALNTGNAQIQNNETAFDNVNGSKQPKSDKNYNANFAEKGNALKNTNGAAAEKLPVKSKKEKAEKPAKKDKTDNNSKPLSKKLPIIIGAVVALAIVVVIIVRIASALNTVTIAGEDFKKSDSTISFNEPVKLNSQDVYNMALLEDCYSIDLNGCSFDAALFDDIMNLNTQSLRLSNCSITDDMINAADLKTVKFSSLYIDGNDISTLGNINSEKIRYLDISNTKINDLSFLENYAQLTEISADNCNISDVSPLKNLTLITSISLNGNNINNIKDLSALEKLETLKLGSNSLTSLSGVENCILLKEIDVSSNKLSDLNPLSNCTVIQDIDISNNSISDISVLEKSQESLKKLVMNNNKVSDLSPISNCVNLYIVECDSNNISNLNFAEKLSALQNLSASNNKITDAAGISNLTLLEYIDLSNNEITSFKAPVFGKEYSSTLILSNNDIDEIDLGYSKINIVDISENDLNDMSVLTKNNISTIIMDYSSETDYSLFSSDSFLKIYMVDCPKDQQVDMTERFVSIEFVDSSSLPDVRESVY